MTLYGTKEQVEKFPGFYSSLEKDLEEWNHPKKLIPIRKLIQSYEEQEKIREILDFPRFFNFNLKH